MAEPVIVFNNDTGDDGTAATSGAPASLTPVTGEAAAHTNGSASTTITLTNTPDLSNVPTDGTAAVRLNTSSGRKWSKITGVDNTGKTLTVADSFNIASGSAVDYAIGGKRSDLDAAANAQLFSDVKQDWVIEIQHTGTDYEITSKKTIAGSGAIVTGSGSSRPVVTGNFNDVLFAIPSRAGFIRYIDGRTTNATNTATALCSPGGDGLNNGTFFVLDCIASGMARGIANSNTGMSVVAVGNTFRNLAGYAVFRVAGNFGGRVICINNRVESCAGLFNAAVGSTPPGDFIAIGNVIDSPSDDAIYQPISTFVSGNSVGVILIGNTFYNGESGKSFVDQLPAQVSAFIACGNIFSGSGEYDINDSTFTMPDARVYVNHNTHYSPTSGAYSSGRTEADGSTSDPKFTNAASHDFSLDSTSPAKGTGWPEMVGALDGTRDSFSDQGAVQREEQGGGGTTPFPSQGLQSIETGVCA